MQPFGHCLRQLAFILYQQDIQKLLSPALDGSGALLKLYKFPWREIPGSTKM
jgi:hypothetical protein